MKNLKPKYILADGTYKSYEFRQAESIKASEDIRCDINKEYDPFKMLNLSLLCISIITGDTEFYNHNLQKLFKINTN